jgi:hypothetical protein
MMKSINVNKMFKLFGDCLYNLQVLCWYILYAGRMCNMQLYLYFNIYVCAYVGMNNKQYKMHGMYITMY